MCSGAGRRRFVSGAVAVWCGLAGTALPAQQPADLEKSRQRLEQSRAERDRLRQDQERLQGQVWMPAGSSTTWNGSAKRPIGSSTNWSAKSAGWAVNSTTPAGS